MMINKQKKRLEITLTNEDIELLNSLASRFNITKSNVIKQALKVFAAKRKHIFTISYKQATKCFDFNDDNNYYEPQKNSEEISDEEWNKLFEKDN